MRVGMRLSVIFRPLPAHRFRPIIERAQTLGQRWVRQAYLDTAAEISLRRKTGIVSDA
jgi:hypothetical protein